MSGPRLVVDVDVVVRREPDEERRHVRHALSGTMVRAGTATFDVTEWQEALADICAVTARPSTSPAPMPELELPWDLVLGTGAALDRHRFDLYDVLVARDVGSVSAGGRPLALAAIHTQLRRLHRSVLGRLRCVGTDRAARRVGWVSWLLYDDGWRALTPYAAGGRPMVRLEPREPADLGRDVAGWAVPR